MAGEPATSGRCRPLLAAFELRSTYADAKTSWPGYADGTYGPTLNVDRGQMAVFVARSIATPTGDVAPGHFHSSVHPHFPGRADRLLEALSHVEYLKQAKIVGGDQDGDDHRE